jgi:Na+/H+ antiporter NhaD/arsenite permease-like protein
MELNPVPVLMATVVYSNIGGSITPVGDPPNVIIASNQDVIDSVRITALHYIGILCKLRFLIVSEQLQIPAATACRSSTHCMDRSRTKAMELVS